MPVNTEFFKLAIQLAAPAARESLSSPTTKGNVVTLIVNDVPGGGRREPRALEEGGRLIGGQLRPRRTRAAPKWRARARGVACSSGRESAVSGLNL